MKTDEPKMVYLLPNLMTAGNLLCGFMAVLQIFEGTILHKIGSDDWVNYYERSLFYILGAFIFDMLDGRVARLGGQESPFGREFDSLADIVSFGVAPALLLFKIVLIDFQQLGWFIASLYLLCGAMRLARFNVLAASGDKGAMKSFTGFPIPAAAGLIASITLLLLHLYEAEKNLGNWKYLLAALMVFLSFMMFSKVQYPSFKSIDWRTQRSVPRVMVIALVIVGVVLYYQYALAAVFTLYLLYGFFRPYVAKAWRPEPDEEAED